MFFFKFILIYLEILSIYIIFLLSKHANLYTEQLFNYIVLCFTKLQILARISSFSLLRSQYNFCSVLRTWKFWQILLILLNISVLVICKMWSFEWKRNVRRFCLSFVYICIAVGDPIIKWGRLIPVTGLTPSHLVPVPCHDLDFQCYMPWLFLCSMNCGERWTFDWLILVELLTITV